jgi:hypothetical protein
MIECVGYPVRRIEPFWADAFIEVTGWYSQLYYGTRLFGDSSLFRKVDIEKLEGSGNLWTGDRIHYGCEFGCIVSVEYDEILFESDDHIIKGLGPVSVSGADVEVIGTIAGGGHVERGGQTF